MTLALFEILGAGIYRMFPHPPNFTPIAAMAVVGGLYLGRRHALVIPLLAMLFSDLLIGLLRGANPFHASIWAVYLGFAIYGVIGMRLRGRASAPRLTLGLLFGSVLFFLLTNTAVWLAYYPHTLTHWSSVMAAGLPFYRNQVLGDFAFTFAFVGLIELSRRQAAASDFWAFLARPARD